jgi:acyl carrier protein phosphodiesterase
MPPAALWFWHILIGSWPHLHPGITLVAFLPTGSWLTFRPQADAPLRLKRKRIFWAHGLQWISMISADLFTLQTFVEGFSSFTLPRKKHTRAVWETATLLEVQWHDRKEQNIQQYFEFVLTEKLSLRHGKGKAEFVHCVGESGWWEAVQV